MGESESEDEGKDEKMRSRECEGRSESEVGSENEGGSECESEGGCESEGLENIDQHGKY